MHENDSPTSGCSDFRYECPFVEGTKSIITMNEEQIQFSISYEAFLLDTE